jgi:hypothetical protein
MSEPTDPFEAELSALRPREVSPDLRRRIAERLASPPPAPHRRVLRLAFAGGLAAACVAAVLLRWGAGANPEPGPIADRPRPSSAAEASEAGPTLLAYQRALARSPEELTILLDKAAEASPASGPELGRIRAFTRSDAALHALLGDD